MMKYIHLYALFLMFIFYTSCKRQNKADSSNKTELPKDNIKSEIKDVITSSVPSNITRTIKQDGKGNIWIAAFDGVFQYDGKSFTNITSKVSSARFFSVLEDRKGNLWFGSIGSGVYYYDGKSFRNFTTKDGLADDRVTEIYEDKACNIWFGVNGGTSRYDGKSFRNYMMNGDVVIKHRTRKSLPDFAHSNNEVTSIIEDKTGKFWFGTRANTFVYDGKTFTALIHNGKPFRNVRTIIEDKKGNIWLGGNEGLWRYEGGTFINVTQNFVGYIYEDAKGNIWTSSANHVSDQNWVLSRYEAKSLSNKRPTVSEIKPKVGMLFGILEDDKGNIWFGTLGGVHRYNGSTITDFKSKEDKRTIRKHIVP